MCVSRSALCLGPAARAAHALSQYIDPCASHACGLWVRPLSAVIWIVYTPCSAPIRGSSPMATRMRLIAAFCAFRAPIALVRALPLCL